MGIFGSASRFITTFFDRGADIIDSAGRSISIVTEYVDNRAIEQQMTDEQIVMDRITETLQPIRDKLESDEKYAALHKQISEDFIKRKAKHKA